MPAPGPMVSSSAIRISFPNTMPAIRKIPKNSSEFCVSGEPDSPSIRGDNQRHRPDRDRHRDQIGQDRDRAAQQAGIEAGDDGNDQSDIDRRHRSCSWTIPCACSGRDDGQQNRFAIAKIVCINDRTLRSAEFVMSGLFDVSKETILITGASQGLGRQFARVLSAHGAAVALAARQTAKLKSLEDEIRGRAAAPSRCRWT